MTIQTACREMSPVHHEVYHQGRLGDRARPQVPDPARDALSALISNLEPSTWRRITPYRITPSGLPAWGPVDRRTGRIARVFVRECIAMGRRAAHRHDLAPDADLDRATITAAIDAVIAAIDAVIDSPAQIPEMIGDLPEDDPTVAPLWAISRARADVIKLMRRQYKEYETRHDYARIDCGTDEQRVTSRAEAEGAYAYYCALSAAAEAAYGSIWPEMYYVLHAARRAVDAGGEAEHLHNYLSALAETTAGAA